MKNWISVAAVLAILLCLSFTSAQAQWNYVKLFPNSNATFSSGLNNTLAVDPDGNVWFAPYVNKSDSIQQSSGKYVGACNLFKYNPSGTLLQDYKYFTYQASVDTFFSPSTGYGMTTDHEGNIVVLKGSDVLRKINYQTGEQMLKVVDPLAGYASSLASPAVDDLDEVFITTVIPTTNVGPAALTSDWTSIAATVDTGMGQQFSRTIAVTPDGNDVFVFGLGIKAAVHYHSSSGTLGGYTIADTLFKGLVIESAAWRPTTKQLWVSSGSNGGGPPDSPWSSYAWYAFDMTNVNSPVLVDSINWNENTGVAADSLKNDPRPRGIAFSPNGNTVYLGAFGPATGFIEVFQHVTSVTKDPNGVVNTYALAQNFPNPFNPSTEIKFSIAKSGMTTLKVYDLLGREVASLVNGELTAGSHNVTFDASKLSSGTYVYELRSGDTRLVNKMMLIK